MKTPRRNISSLVNPRKYSEQIPDDLITEIFSRLPAKSVGRCRCVSKLWNSTLRLPCFSDLFLTRASSRPQLLFSCEGRDNLLFFSSPQSQNTGGYSLSLVSAGNQIKFPTDDNLEEISESIHGLICVTHIRATKSKNEMIAVICNPTTGQSLTLPELRVYEAKCFFGYDPIDKQYKVLSMTRQSFPGKVISWDHQVLTLGIENLRWRKVKCSINHRPLLKGICIYGVLYYVAEKYVHSGEDVIDIVCFDVRTEKFRSIKGDKGISLRDVPLLVNYKGKLGALSSYWGNAVHILTKSFELWVLENAEKHEWSKHVYEVPSSCLKNLVGNANLYFVGVTSTNELVLCPSYLLTNPFIVVYYNIERNTIRSDEIEGMIGLKLYRVHTFVNHVENVKSLWMHHN